MGMGMGMAEDGGQRDEMERSLRARARALAAAHAFRAGLRRWIQPWRRVSPPRMLTEAAKADGSPPAASAERMRVQPRLVDSVAS
eukprot:7747949-Pyramimonas_sp.AAC.1